MKKFMFISLWITLLCFAQASYAATTEDITVEAKGTGKTREEAINAALIEAIAKVRGISVASAANVVQNLSMQNEEKTTDNTSSSNLNIEFGESSKQSIATATSGVVKTYQIFSEISSELNPGYIDVVLSVTIPRYKETIANKRKSIALMPFRLEQSTEKNAKFVDLLSSEITNFLTQTRRFAILDRDYLDEKHSEFDFLLGDDIKTTEKIRIGNTLGTDYILTGTLLYTQAHASRETVAYINETNEIITIESALSWRLIEVATGQILLSKNTHFKHELEDPNDTLWMHTVVASMGEEIAQDIMDNIYPLMPVSYINNRLVIPQGSETVKLGQMYTLIRQGEIIYDPYTKEAVGREETGVGIVEITQISPKISYARIKKTVLTENDLNNLKERQYILRPLLATEYKYDEDVKKVSQPTQTPNW